MPPKQGVLPCYIIASQEKWNNIYGQKRSKALVGGMKRDN